MSGSTDFFGLKVPFLKHLGVKAEMAEGGRSRISLERRPELMNSFEVSLHFCEGEAFDQSGELVAKSLGTFKLRREPRSRAE